MVQDLDPGAPEQPFRLRVHWQGGPTAEGPLEIDGAVAMLEGASGVLPVPYEPYMRASRTAIRILVGGLLGHVLEQSPDHTWLVEGHGSAWAIPGRSVLAVEVFDPVEAPSGVPNPIGFQPPVRIGEP